MDRVNVTTHVSTSRMDSALGVEARTSRPLMRGSGISHIEPEERVRWRGIPVVHASGMDAGYAGSARPPRPTPYTPCAAHCARITRHRRAIPSAGSGARAQHPPAPLHHLALHHAHDRCVLTVVFTPTPPDENKHYAQCSSPRGSHTCRRPHVSPVNPNSRLSPR